MKNKSTPITRGEKKTHNRGFDDGYRLGLLHGKEYIIKDEKRIEKLAEIYKKDHHDAYVVAMVCDEVIDQSGGLLGEVRKTARFRKTCEGCKWRHSEHEDKCDKCVLEYSMFERDEE